VDLNDGSGSGSVVSPGQRQVRVRGVVIVVKGVKPMGIVQLASMALSTKPGKVENEMVIFR
jgi:hypothetical protein